MLRRPLNIRIVGQTNTTTAVLISTDRVPPGEVWETDYGFADNQSGESVTAVWCLLRGATTIQCSADVTLASAKGTGTNILPDLLEGEQLALKVTGTANKGPVTMVLSGYRKYVEEEDVEVA